MPQPRPVSPPGDSRSRRRRGLDLLSRQIVRAGGLATVLSILTILFFLAWEVAPLLQRPTAQASGTGAASTAAEAWLLAGDEYREWAEILTRDGRIRFVRLADGTLASEIAVPGLGSSSIREAIRVGPDETFLLLDHELLALRTSFLTSWKDGIRHREPRITEQGRWPVGEADRGGKIAVSALTEQGLTLVAGEAPTLIAIRESRSLLGGVRREEFRRPLPIPSGAPVSAVAIDGRGSRVVMGTEDGRLHLWDTANPDQPHLLDVAEASAGGSPVVSALGFLNGDQSIVVGDEEGRVSAWQPVRDDTRQGGWALQRLRDFAPHPAAVTAMAASPRDKGFLTADRDGNVVLHHSTSGQTLLTLPGRVPDPREVRFSPKGDGALALAGSGALHSWAIDNPHPEITLASLFGRVWYEGYEEPAFVWQSTGGTDDFEPKFSLVPLLLGTLKGTVWALLFALPIAVLAALYTSQFCHPTLRGIVKPAVEIMAALPSVVLGFLAGLWLAPLLENRMPAVLALAVLFPLFAMLAGSLRLPSWLRVRVPHGLEALSLAPCLVALVAACWAANGPLEQVFFGGDFRAWVGDALGSRFDQRNSVVVGFAMGFAVIPIIFTISEDALSNVPPRLASASLALGATPWQTALRVVLPTASPGIFSAAMVGFGRAVGETMIVLMATGNTPVLDFSLFTGMRTMAANIAVEIPEAPVESTLYRVLFLSALLLFLLTFSVNTVAELVRQRLRHRYQRL